jgi:hypothetical protein
MVCLRRAARRHRKIGGDPTTYPWSDFSAAYRPPSIVFPTQALIETDCERTIFAIRAHNNNVIIEATDKDLDDLLGAVAAEADHEPNRRRQPRLDAAFDALSAAAQTPHGY